MKQKKRPKNSASSFKQLVNDSKTVRRLEEIDVQTERNRRVEGKKKGMM